MKYIIIPFIALGLVLSSIVCIEYDCLGSDVLSKYVGSPFIFKKSSLGASLEYCYSIGGILVNTLIWSMLVAGLHIASLKMINRRENNRVLKRSYSIIVGILIAFALLNVSWSFYTACTGFDKSGNYWVSDMDQVAKDYNAECKGELKFFRF